jgi:hypothetical protein
MLAKSRLPQAVVRERLELNNYAYFGAIPIWAIATLYISPTRVFAEARIRCFAVWHFTQTLKR